MWLHSIGLLLDLRAKCPHLLGQPRLFLFQRHQLGFDRSYLFTQFGPFSFVPITTRNRQGDNRQDKKNEYGSVFIGHEGLLSVVKSKSCWSCARAPRCLARDGFWQAAEYADSA